MRKQVHAKLETLSQQVICPEVAPISPGPWLEELHCPSIHMTDTQEVDPIELLTGSDFAANLYTGRKHELSCGLVELGWT